MPGTHATLSASKSERWINCPGSIRASHGIPDRQSEYAAEGTVAHRLGETCIKEGRDAIEFVDRRIVEGDFTFTVDDDMSTAVQVYLDHVRPLMADPDVEYETEQRLDLGALYPGMFGTGDFIAYNTRTRDLEVVDYKHGRGVAVEVKENTQLLYYAVGAAMRHHNRGVDTVRITVVQPRCPHPDGPVRSWPVNTVDLLEWSSDLVATARRTEEPDAPLVPGDWCNFCPAAPGCKALQARALESARADFAVDGSVIVADATLLKPEELAEVLAKVDVIEGWCRRVREYAHHEAEAGRCPPGYKLVATRALRRWKNPDDALDHLRMVLDVEPEHILTTPELRSPAQVEAALKQHYGLKGKRAGEALVPLVVKQSSGTVVAPLSDPRDPVRPEPEKDFEPVVETGSA